MSSEVNERNFKSEIIIRYFDDFPIEFKGNLEICMDTEDEFIHINHYAATPDNDVKLYKKSLIKKDGIKEITIIEDVK